MLLLLAISKRKFVVFWNLFFILKKNWKRNSQHVFLMLNPRLKKPLLVSFLIGLWGRCEYCWKMWLTIFISYTLKDYHHLHQMKKSKVECVEWKFDKNSNLDIFEKIANTREPMKKLVTKELLIFRSYQVDPHKIKCPFQWWG